MPRYLLSNEAEQDLRELIRYTKNEWGDTQVRKYRELLTTKFESIARKRVPDRLFSKAVQDLFFIKAGSHYIFYLRPKDQTPIIIAILHPRTEVLKNISKRL